MFQIKILQMTFCGHQASESTLNFDALHTCKFLYNTVSFEVGINRLVKCFSKRLNQEQKVRTKINQNYKSSGETSGPWIPVKRNRGFLCKGHIVLIDYHLQTQI